VKRRRGGVIEATVFALAGMAMLAGLGIWQLDRKVWKEHLVATLDARLSRPPAPLPPR
jgi:surfeit locus 1 family protein